MASGADDHPKAGARTDLQDGIWLRVDVDILENGRDELLHRLEYFLAHLWQGVEGGRAVGIER